MTGELKSLIETAAAWPEEDQAELAAYAREIVARRTGTYFMTHDERRAVDEGIDQTRRGEFVSDEDMHSFWKRAGIA